MERSGRLTIIVATLLLAGLEPWPCHAQPPGLLPPASPPALSAPLDPGQAVATGAGLKVLPPPGPRTGRRVLLASSAPTVPSAASPPAPTPARDDLAVNRQPAPLEPIDLRTPILVFPAPEDLLDAAAHESSRRRWPIDVAAAFQRPSASTTPLSASAAALAPPAGDLSLRLQPAPLEPTDL